MRRIEKALWHYGSKALREKTAKHFAFTLAEVLITLAIIGVVAAMTIPNLVQDYTDRQYKTTSSTFQRKLGEALKIMNAQNNLEGYDTTKEFVNELSKNFKIIKVCDTVTDCFTDKYLNDDETKVDVSTLTTSESLGHPEYETETVGVQFANGINGIVAYNKYFSSNNGVAAKFSESESKKTKVVTLSTTALTMLIDLNGYEKPNRNGADILGINMPVDKARPSGIVQVGKYQILDLGTNYAPIACTESLAATDNKDYCGDKPSGYANDYWMGAHKACKDKEMKLPNQTELADIWSLGSQSAEYKGLTPSSGKYWTSSEGSDNYARFVDFSSGVTHDSTKYYSQTSVLCIGN